MNKYIALLAVPCFLNASQSALVVKPTNVFVPSRIGPVTLTHANNRFNVTQNGVSHRVLSHNIDSDLRSIAKAGKLNHFLNNGYISVNQNGRNEFTLAANGRLKGGGPIAAGIAYWVTKTLCYGTALAAAGTVATATVGAGGAVLTTVTAGLTSGAGAGASATSALIGYAGMAGAATEATVSTVSAAGGVATAAAAIESASTGVAAFFLGLPIP